MIDPELMQEFDRRLNSVADLISQLAHQMDARFEAMNTRFDVLESKLSRMDTRLAAMEMQMHAFHKALDDHERVMLALQSTQAAQQKAIDGMITRLQRIEQRSQSQ
jgi:hypothetical protein